MDVPAAELQQRRRSDRVGVALLLAILLIAAGLRVYRLGAQPFWTDEFFTLMSSTASGITFDREIVDNAPPRSLAHAFTRFEGWHPLAIWRDAVFDVHPPLFAIALSAWRGLIGQGQAATRLLPVLCSIATIAIVALSLRAQTGRWRPALWTAAISLRRVSRSSSPRRRGPTR